MRRNLRYAMRGHCNLWGALTWVFVQSVGDADVVVHCQVRSAHKSLFGSVRKTSLNTLRTFEISFANNNFVSSTGKCSGTVQMNVWKIYPSDVTPELDPCANISILLTLMSTIFMCIATRIRYGLRVNCLLFRIKTVVDGG